MNYGYKEIRKIHADSLRTLCIEKQWYTRGDCKAYEHLLNDLAGSKENITTDDVVEIAQDIIEHSETEQEFTSVCFDVARIAVTFFEKMQKMTYSEKRMEELESKGRNNWNEDDWDSYHYIEQLRFESGYYDD